MGEVSRTRWRDETGEREREMCSVMGVHGCAVEMRGMENNVRGIGGRARRGAVGEEGEKEKGRQLCGVGRVYKG